MGRSVTPSVMGAGAMLLREGDLTGFGVAVGAGVTATEGVAVGFGWAGVTLGVAVGCGEVAFGVALALVFGAGVVFGAMVGFALGVAVDLTADFWVSPPLKSLRKNPKNPPDFCLGAGVAVGAGVADFTGTARRTGGFSASGRAGWADCAVAGAEGSPGVTVI